MVDDVFAHFGAGAGNGEQDFFHAVAVDEVADFGRLVHRQVVNHHALDGGVVIHKGHGVVFAHLFDGFQQLAAGLAGTVDNHRNHLLAVAVGEHGAQHDARAGNQHHQHQKISHRQGQAQPLLKQQHAEEKQHAGNGAAQHRGGEHFGAHIAGDGAVKPQAGKHQNGQYGRGGKSQPVGRIGPFLRIAGFQILGEPKRHKNHHRIVYYEDDFFNVARQGE